MIILHPDGKSAMMNEQKIWLPLLQQGFSVLWPDLSGSGEIGEGGLKGDSYDFSPGKANYNLWFAALSVGKSLIAFQAEEVIRLQRFLANRSNTSRLKVSAIAYGVMSPVLLHAAVFESAIERIALLGGCVSYADLVVMQFYKPAWVLSSVAGSLGNYDLQDLAAAIAPRPLLWWNGCDADDHMLSQKECEQQWAYVQRMYAVKGAKDKLHIKANDSASDGSMLAKAWGCLID